MSGFASHIALPCLPAPVGKIREWWAARMVCSFCGRIIVWWEVGLASRDEVALGPFLCADGCPCPPFDWRQWSEDFETFDGPPVGGGL